MPVRRLHLAASLLALAACAAEPIEPPGPLLIGAWGSDDAELIAIRAGAEIRLACATITVEAPIRRAGRLDGSGARLGPLPLVDVTGSLRNSRVSLTVPSSIAQEPVTYLLEAGVTRSPSDAPTCQL